MMRLRCPVEASGFRFRALEGRAQPVRRRGPQRMPAALHDRPRSPGVLLAKPRPRLSRWHVHRRVSGCVIAGCAGGSLAHSPARWAASLSAAIRVVQLASEGLAQRADHLARLQGVVPRRTSRYLSKPAERHPHGCEGARARDVRKWLAWSTSCTLGFGRHDLHVQVQVVRGCVGDCDDPRTSERSCLICASPTACERAFSVGVRHAGRDRGSSSTRPWRRPCRRRASTASEVNPRAPAAPSNARPGSCVKP